MDARHARLSVRALETTTDTVMSRLARATLCALLGVLLAASAAHAGDDPLLAPPGRCAGDSDPSAHHRVQRLAMHCLIDAVRRRAGVRRLRSSVELRRSATYKARRIASCRTFTHTPCGDELAVPFRQAAVSRGRSWRIGEDLAWGVGSTSTPRVVLGKWLRSPPHRAVLVDPGFTRIGLRRRRVAMRGAPKGAVIWVAHLGQPAR
jgi:hypothetical protein